MKKKVLKSVLVKVNGFAKPALIQNGSDPGAYLKSTKQNKKSK